MWTKLLDNALKLADDAMKIAVAPVDAAISTARIVTKPVADAAEDVADHVVPKDETDNGD